WLERRVKSYPLVVLGVAAFYLLVSAIAVLPLDYYEGFVREHAYGLSTQTAGAWFADFARDLGINLVLGSMGLVILYLIVRATGRSWWIWGALASVGMLAFLNFVSPVAIAPLSNHYTEMAEGPLKQDILGMAQANGVPTENVYVFDLSQRRNVITA